MSVVVFILIPCVFVVKKRLGKITRKCVGVKVKKRRRANRSEVCRYECRQYNMYTKKYQTRNKYGAVKQTYGGRSYHSKKEAAYAQELDWRLKAGEITEIIPQFKLELYVKGIKICNYCGNFFLF